MKIVKNVFVFLFIFSLVSCSKQKKSIIIGDSLELPIISNSKSVATSINKVEKVKKSIFSEYVDYRKFQTKVKNQGERGTCTAFSVASTLEILPGVPADVSEQYIYGALKHSQPNVKFYEGDFLRNYIKSLNEYGFIHENKLKYKKIKISWDANDTDFTKILNSTQIDKGSLKLLKYYTKYSITDNNQFRYYDYNGASSIENIKHLLNQGVKSIAVIYISIHGPSRKAGCTTEKPLDLNTVIDVVLNDKRITYKEAKSIYQGDLVDALKTNKVKNLLKDVKDNYGGHAVNIVGYNKKGFIIKNSWSTDWADNGYGYVSYDLHRLTCTEALVIDKISFVKPKTVVNVNSVSEFYLKSTLSNNNNGKKYFQLSIFTSDILADPFISSVTYKIYGANNKLLATKTKLANNITGTYDNSFNVEFFKNNLMEPDLLFGKPVNVVAEIYSNTNKGKRMYYFNNVFLKTAEYKSEDQKKVSNLLRLNNN